MVRRASAVRADAAPMRLRLLLEADELHDARQLDVFLRDQIAELPAGMNAAHAELSQA